MPVVKAYELEGYVNGTIVASPEFLTIEKDEEPQPNPLLLDRLILFLIKSIVINRALGNIVRATTTYEAWLIIECIFQHQSRAHVMQVRRELKNFSEDS